MPIDLSPSAILAASKGIDLDSDTTPNINNQKPSKLFRFLPTLGQAADGATTLIASNPESNPIYGGSKAAAIGGKVGMSVLGYYLIKALEQQHPSLAKTLSIGLMGSGAIPAGINISRMK